MANEVHKSQSLDSPVLRMAAVFVIEKFGSEAILEY